jgi:cytoskeletal protein RodZ
MAHDDHAVENNPRKETLFAGVCLLMLAGIVGLIAFGGLTRPVAPQDPMAVLKTVPVGSTPTVEPTAVATPAPQPAVAATMPAAVVTDAPAATPASSTDATVATESQPAVAAQKADPSAEKTESKDKV